MNKFPRLGDIAGLLQLAFAGIPFTITQVLANGPGKEQGFLRNKTNLLAQGLEVVVADIDAIHQDLTQGDIIEARNELN